VLGNNLTGLFKLTRAVLPAMITAGRGSIVNITSEAGLRGSASGDAYTVSKHGVIGLTRSTAFRYGPQGIRVNAVPESPFPPHMPRPAPPASPPSGNPSRPWPPPNTRPPRSPSCSPTTG